jgi:hypothetical protein
LCVSSRFFQSFQSKLDDIKQFEDHVRLDF